MLQYDWHSLHTPLCLFGQWYTLFLGEEWLIFFFIVSGCCCVRRMLQYDWHSSYASICLFVQYCAICFVMEWLITSPYYQAVAVCSECCSMTGIHCIHQLSIFLYLLACLILPYYLAIAVGGGCCSMTGIHRMQYNTWEHD